jgi:hypothetical protein
VNQFDAGVLGPLSFRIAAQASLTEFPTLRVESLNRESPFFLKAAILSRWASTLLYDSQSNKIAQLALSRSFVTTISGNGLGKS